MAEVDGEIKAGTLQYLERAVRDAQTAQADYLVVKLNTPGGLLKATWDIVDLFLGAGVETVVFVNRPVGEAFSAGTFVLLSADYAFVYPTASIGAAQPIEMFGGTEMPDKIIEATASKLKELAAERGRNPEIAEKFVRENLTLSGKEAQEQGIIDGTAGSLDELFSFLGIISPEVIEVKPTPIDDLFDFLSHPYLVSLFLTLGGLGLILAFRTGEFEITGLISLIFLLVGFWGMGIITFNVLGIIFLVLGIFLLFLEIIEPGFGVFGFLGIASLVLGIFTLEGEPFLRPVFFDAATMLVLGVLAGIVILFIIIGRGAIGALKIKPKTGIESLIGLQAEVIEELNLTGRVMVGQESWRAEAVGSQKITAGLKVEIMKIEGNTLFVKKLEKQNGKQSQTNIL